MHDDQTALDVARCLDYIREAGTATYEAQDILVRHHCPPELQHIQVALSGAFSALGALAIELEAWLRGAR